MRSVLRAMSCARCPAHNEQPTVLPGRLLVEKLTDFWSNSVPTFGKKTTVHSYKAYLTRTIDQELDELLPFAPAIAIDGPKGVGKTDTALRRAEHVYRLDNPEQREVLAASFDLSAIPSGTTLLDEWQHLPQI